MSRLITALAVLALSAPLIAGEPKVIGTEQKVVTADSPLVAAAKRSKRLGKKPGFVITNENLGTLGLEGHISTTSTQAELPPVSAASKPAPAPVRAQEPARQATASGSADTKKKAETAAQAAAPDVDTLAEGDAAMDDEPGDQERRMAEEAKAKPKP
jgi:hypothetical protein